jgi:hydroxyacylglutathione hydrolase
MRDSDISHAVVLYESGLSLVAVGATLNRLDELDRAAPTVVYCAGGYRSSVAASLLRTQGFDDVSDLLGGFRAWAEYIHSPVR